MKATCRYITFITAGLICLFTILMLPVTGIAKELGFCPGEKMTFEVKWAFIPAGKVTLEVLPCEKLDGLPVLHFLFTAKTSKLVDAFYKVRDRIESFADINLTHSLLYKKRHEGNKSVRESTVTFDWKKKEARYTNSENETGSIQIDENTFDPLSVYYAFRVEKPNKNNEIIVRVTDGKKLIKATGKIIKKQKIKVAGKSYNTLLVQPEIEGVSGVFKKTKNSKLRIWVTDDKRRIPVRIKSAVTVGSFVADLIAYTQGNEVNLASSAQTD